MESGSHAHQADKRNENIQIYVNGELLPRNEAKISVLDSGFLLGDGVWEGLRLHNGKLAFAKKHFDRLYEGAKAIDLEIGVSAEELEKTILETCRANDMESGVHIRLIISRGLKSTPFQSPKANVGKATVVIITEWKEINPKTLVRGLSLHTVHIQRGAPTIQDPLWNSLSKLNCISACIQAEKAGADEALMLDPHGFVATCNSTHFFIVCDNELWTSSGLYCIQGITRSNIIERAKKIEVTVREESFSLTKAYSADEAFVTGTFAGVIPVRSIDGRIIGKELPGVITARLRTEYLKLIDQI